MNLPKTLALILFASISFVGFFFGYKFYQQATTQSPPSNLIQPTPTKNLINMPYWDSGNKIMFNYRLLSGWQATKDTVDRVDGEKFEVLTISKGDYQIKVGGPQTGAVPCVDDDRWQFTTLNNKYLGTTVIRTVLDDNTTATENEYILHVCTSHSTNSDPQSITKYGWIDYLVPLNWNSKVIKEMDLIIESIRPLSDNS